MVVGLPGRAPHGVVIVAVDDDRFAAEGANGVQASGNRTAGQQHLAAAAELGRHPGHGRAVVAVRSGHEGKSRQGLANAGLAEIGEVQRRGHVEMVRQGGAYSV